MKISKQKWLWNKTKFWTFYPAWQGICKLKARLEIFNGNLNKLFKLFKITRKVAFPYSPLSFYRFILCIPSKDSAWEKYDWYRCRYFHTNEIGFKLFDMRWNISFSIAFEEYRRYCIGYIFGESLKRRAC